MKKLFLILTVFAIQGSFAMENYDQALINAAAQIPENEAEVKRLIKLGANVNVQALGGHRTFPLYEASRRGHYQVTKFLLDNGAKVNLVNTQGVTPLMAAVATDKIKIVRLLLKYGADVNAQAVGLDNLCALGHAIYKGRYHLVKLLLDQGADINMADSAGATPLHVAAIYGFDKIVRLLLARGANRNLVDMHGRTPLDCAQANGDAGVVRLLTEAGSAP